jgi:hypothetical protein
MTLGEVRSGLLLQSCLSFANWKTISISQTNGMGHLDQSLCNARVARIGHPSIGASLTQLCMQAFLSGPTLIIRMGSALVLCQRTIRLAFA